MRIRVLFAVAAGLLMAADTPKSSETKSELKKLQGTWAILSSETNGAAVAGEDIENGKVILKGNNYTVETPDGTKNGTFAIDPTKKPHALDATTSDGQKIEAIYEVKENMLKICFAKNGGDRPTKFATAGEEEWVLLVCKRMKEKKE